jgi:short subunit dehydrogenase-like uncharacterized protein
MSAERELDVVLYGATGFVGKLTAEYLARNAPPTARIGLGGRSQEKLETLKASLGAAAQDWPVVVADSQDTAALKAMAERTTAIATTVGPYKQYGTPLVQACVDAGTHYGDLTGESLFMRETIDRFDAPAQASGARIVHNCGFDSIPSDIGVWLLHEELGELRETTFVVRRLKGGASGGTIASLKGTIDDIKKDRSLLKVVGDPYGLSPDRKAEPKLGNERDLQFVEHSEELGTWLAPFVMAAINTRVVRRSNALLGWPYGREFKYREVMAMGDGITGRAKGMALAGGLGALTAGLAVPPSRFVLDKVLPDPGEGPKDELVKNGFYEIEIHTKTPSGEHWVCDVQAKGDPGYGATAVMLGESALCLGLDTGELPERAGVLTPATAMGTVLAERLRAAGQVFDVHRA